MKKILLYTIILQVVVACGRIDDEYIERSKFYPIDWTEAADSSTTSFITGYWNPTKHHFNNDNFGTIGTHDYWPEAHGMEVFLDAYIRTGDEKYKQLVYDFYEGVKTKNGGSFWNNYYDDMAWHGVAHLRALEITGDVRYEESAKYLWTEILKGWNDDDGGGIRWNHEDNAAGRSKGVPTNGPSAIIAARRWEKYGNTETFEGMNDSIWFVRIYEWMKENRTIRQTGRVFDNREDTGGDWTYNTGTFMGAALEFYNITGEKKYFDDAVKTADWTTSTLINTTNRVLSDWAEQEDHDVNLFKGIFIRYFTQLIMHPDLPEGNRKRYIAFMKNSAQYLWVQGAQKDPLVFYGYHWWEAPGEGNTPSGTAALRTQISGATLMEAMGLLKKEGYFD